MLYVSRYFGANEYGVVDTDDGKETIVPQDVVQNAHFKLHMNIAGVSAVAYLQFDGVDICEIFPYQLPSTTTQLQVKTNLLRHVSVCVWNNIVTSVRWRVKEITEPVVIRLSDFGSELGDRFLCGNSQANEHKITLVLDDKLELRRFSFWRPMSLEESDGLLVDVHEVTRESLLELFYHQWVADGGGPSFKKRMDAVIDSASRKRRMLKRLRGW